MRKFVSLFLAVLLLLSLLPGGVLAADTAGGNSLSEGAPASPEKKAPTSQAAFLSDVTGWPGYEHVFDTPAFSKSGTSTSDFTDNEEMVTYLQSLLSQCSHMYYFTLGTSPTYKLDFPLVVFTKTDLSGMTMEEAGAAVYANGKATVLHQAQIHGNEPAAGEGSLALAGALARGDLKDGNGGDILDSVNVMIIPRINPDGSRKFQRNNTANSINLNRDYLAVRSTEVEMVLEAYNAFLPDVVIDAHEWTPSTSSGTGYFDDLQLWAAGSLNNDSALLDTSIEMMETVFAAAEAQGIRPYFYQGVMTFGAGSNSIGPWYYGLRGTFGFCVETRGIGIGWENFARRVISQYLASESLLQYTAAHGGELRAAAEAERVRIAEIGETYEETDKLVLQHKSRSYGKAYRRPTVNADSNRVTNSNTTSTPTIYDVAGNSRSRPTAYVLQAGTTNLKTVLATLDKHNIQYIQLTETMSLPVQQYSGSGSSASLREEKTVTFRAGSYVFPMNQSGGNVLAMLMEPDVNDTASPSEALSTFVQKKTLSASAIYRYQGSLDPFADHFLVTFCGEDGRVLETAEVKKGASATYTGEPPVKAYTRDLHYVFAGWVLEDGSPADLTAITADCTVYASFTAREHSYTSQVSKDATCTEEGTLLYSCTGCERTYEETVSLLPHTPELRNEKEATCTEPGYTGDQVCALCHTVIQQGQVIAPKDHSPVTVSGKAPGCLSSGLSDGEICGVCGLTLVPQQTLPRLGHSYEYTDLENGTHSGICRLCSKTTAPEDHSYGENDCCTLCGSASAPTVDTAIQIRHTLDLLSDISIHYVIEASALEKYDSFYLECQIPCYEGQSLTGYRKVQIQPVLRESRYYFTLDGMAATQMGDEIRAKLCMKAGSGNYCSPEDLYSIADYAYGQMEKSTASQVLKTLCAELLRYGSAAQSYKGYRTDALADRAMTAEQRSYLQDPDTVLFGSCNRVLDDLADPAVTWAGKSLDLGSKVTIRFIVNLSGYTGAPSDLTLRLSYVDQEGGTQTALLTDPVLYREGTPYYAFDFSGLTATELRTTLTGAVYSGDTQVSPTLEYTADTYGNGKTGALKTLCAALFSYSDGAAAYFRSLS